MSAIEVKDLWKAYGDTVILEKVSLSIRSGAFVSLVGPSGCGKSTFLRIVLGQETQTRGTITIDGEPLSAEPSVDRGVVFQRYSVFPHLTVTGNVMLGLELAQSPILNRLFGKARKAAKDEALEWVNHVGLGHAADKYPHELSGGMQQRLAIAQAMIKKPKILLLDEPFGALDPGIRADMHKLMRTLWEETGMTVIMVSHDLPEAFSLGTRVIAFDRTKDRPEEQNAYGATITFDVETKQPFKAMWKPEPVTIEDMKEEMGEELWNNAISM